MAPARRQHRGRLDAKAHIDIMEIKANGKIHGAVAAGHKRLGHRRARHRRHPGEQRAAAQSLQLPALSNLS